MRSFPTGFACVVGFQVKQPHASGVSESPVAEAAARAAQEPPACKPCFALVPFFGFLAGCVARLLHLNLALNGAVNITFEPDTLDRFSLLLGPMKSINMTATAWLIQNVATFRALRFRSAKTKLLWCLRVSVRIRLWIGCLFFSGIFAQAILAALPGRMVTCSSDLPAWLPLQGLLL